jgi:hypothetical protein
METTVINTFKTVKPTEKGKYVVIFHLNNLFLFAALKYVICLANSCQIYFEILKFSLTKVLWT